jgi:hypothetical protein
MKTLNFGFKIFSLNELPSKLDESAKIIIEKLFIKDLIFDCDSLNEESPFWFHCIKQNVKECA